MRKVISICFLNKAKNIKTSGLPQKRSSPKSRIPSIRIVLQSSSIRLKSPHLINPLLSSTLNCLLLTKRSYTTPSNPTLWRKEKQLNLLVAGTRASKSNIKRNQLGILLTTTTTSSSSSFPKVIAAAIISHRYTHRRPTPLVTSHKPNMGIYINIQHLILQLWAITLSVSTTLNA